MLDFICPQQENITFDVTPSKHCGAPRKPCLAIGTGSTKMAKGQVAAGQTFANAASNARARTRAYSLELQTATERQKFNVSLNLHGQ